MIDDESYKSHQFNLDCARYCVEAALHMVDVLPDTLVEHQILLGAPLVGIAASYLSGRGSPASRAVSEYAACAS